MRRYLRVCFFVLRSFVCLLVRSCSLVSFGFVSVGLALLLVWFCLRLLRFGLVLLCFALLLAANVWLVYLLLSIVSFDLRFVDSLARSANHQQPTPICLNLSWPLASLCLYLCMGLCLFCTTCVLCFFVLLGACACSSSCGCVSACFYDILL